MVFFGKGGGGGDVELLQSWGDSEGRFGSGLSSSGILFGRCLPDDDDVEGPSDGGSLSNFKSSSGSR